MARPLIVAMAFVAAACESTADTRVTEDTSFLSDIEEVEHIVVTVGDDDYSVPVYGYRGAMTESEEPDWGGTIIIRILTPQSYSRARWFSNNRNVEIRYDRFAASAAELDRNYDRLSLGQSIPIIHLPGPGVFGAGGRYDEFYSNRAAEVLDGAISLIVSEFEGDHIIVSGASSAGLIVAGLLSMRDDIRCAVIASAPLDLTAHAQFNPAHTHYYGSTEPFDPIRHVHSVLEDRDRTIFIGYSETDQVVSSRYQIDYAEALLELGHSVVLESAPGIDQYGHSLAPWVWQKTLDCVDRE
ncbi:hypothetical protein [Maricaulis sp.]|jgi:hypothetical protein|uniref:alpha/beta hydrolase family protein n=1 Tax=Maricaulis sp. TaxID=1486257 RepID=UPI00260A45F9|nr:hypothetical protein [Maricaulis sp.]MDF1770314.1 hypothetical protein [Maricaulis sp.]